MSSHEYIKSITDIVPDDFPSLEQIPSQSSSISATNITSSSGFLENLTWKTWLIVFLILTLLGINVFTFLSKGTDEVMDLFQNIFNPILKFLGYVTLTTTKQTITTTATGTKTAVDLVADTSTNAIDNITKEINTSNTETTNNIPSGKVANTTLPVQKKIQNSETNIEKWQEDSLEKALENAKHSADIIPDDSRSSIQTTGKSGWCYIGEEQGVRTCSEIGVNDSCMSGDIFPNQEICMNPNLRA